MNELSERLAEIAETSGPDGSVDAPAAIAKGRRVRRRRRWTAALAAAGITAAVAVPIAQAARPDDVDRPRVVEPVKYPNVLVEMAEFGWLPQGYARTRIASGTPGGGTFEVSAGRGPGGGGVTLTLLRPGLELGAPMLPGARRGTLTRAEPVNGRRADWLIKPGDPGSRQIPAEFRFRYRDDAWAKLQITDARIADVPTVRRIAEGVRFGGTGPARFPVRVKGLPEGLKVWRAWVEDGAGNATFMLAGPGRGELMISVGPSTEVSRRQAERDANTTLDGHPAFDTDRPHDGPKGDPATAAAGRILNIYDAEGIDVRLNVRGAELLNRLEKTGGLTGLYHRITFLGPDESTWTTTPLG
ncbi:hypothetical protein [Actinomadura sp. WMMB 499]|uniref:hypothetical protein n=1 Tax=Actinomadura sp. WMMB 499 TaxID=1219491 RepID=UPI00124430D3|nr:hypothetical protein [Actinomadura sp. WMMB 499]QFG23982.1 hypothetical protein F7P10_25510 [Actinomadura sp. WMMB 499]